MGKRPRLGEWKMIERDALKLRIGWKTFWDDLERDEPRRGMYIGWRTVHEGRFGVDHGIDMESWDWIYEHEKSKEVWLFIVHERMNPFYAFPEHVRDLTPEEAGLPF
jgi:hypothetical protein